MAYVCYSVVLQSRGMNVPVPRVVFSTDDILSSYRQVPPSDPDMCIICIYCFDPGNVGPPFVENWGHNFGQSVENWGHNFGHTISVSNSHTATIGAPRSCAAKLICTSLLSLSIITEMTMPRQISRFRVAPTVSLRQASRGCTTLSD
jgi:hypothetical protein